MSLVRYAMENRIVMYVLTILLIGGGAYAYEKLSRLEDPEFTIKEALVVTEYPGASPREVEQEVTDKRRIHPLSQATCYHRDRHGRSQRDSQGLGSVGNHVGDRRLRTLLLRGEQ